MDNTSLYNSFEHIRFLKLDYLSRILRVHNAQAVQAAVSYASVLNEIGVNSENYPLFFEVLNVKNKWVIDALTEGKDLNNFFTVVTPSYHIAQSIFNVFVQNKRGQLYDKTLRILLGYCRKVYREPHKGYAIYPLSISELNNLAKFIREDEPEDEPLNNLILAILRDINELNELSRYKDLGEKIEIAKQAGKIRTNYYDNQRRLRQALTDVILEEVETDNGIGPEYIYSE